MSGCDKGTPILSSDTLGYILGTPLQRTADPYLSGLTLLDPQLSSHTDHTEGGASANPSTGPGDPGDLEPTENG